MTKLNDVRDEQTSHKNRVDTTLADVFSLLSLFFLTIGKTKECPATYCQIASIRVCATFMLSIFHCHLAVQQQLLDHMNESAVYNESDLAPFHRRLGELRDIVHSDIKSGKHPEAMTKLLERQLNECGAFTLHYLYLHLLLCTYIGRHSVLQIYLSIVNHRQHCPNPSRLTIRAIRGTHSAARETS